jgi:hypothetical protein
VRPLVLRTEELPWASSPSPNVWRKRLEHSGPAEAGRVTSLVRYEPGSVFPSHGHPDGEEILVLEGTFCDEHGAYPAGTFLLNPEGFAHAPRSLEGCLLFVKLRQSPGARRAVRVDTTRAAFRAAGPGLGTLELYAEAGFPERIELVRLAAGAQLAPGFLARGADLLVLEGECRDDQSRYGPRTWLRFSPGSRLSLISDAGCLLYGKHETGLAI